MSSNQTAIFQIGPKQGGAAAFEKNTTLPSVGYAMPYLVVTMAMLMMPNKAEAAVLVRMRTLLGTPRDWWNVCTPCFKPFFVHLRP